MSKNCVSPVGESSSSVCISEIFYTRKGVLCFSPVDKVLYTQSFTRLVRRVFQSLCVKFLTVSAFLSTIYTYLFTMKTNQIN